MSDAATEGRQFYIIDVPVITKEICRSYENLKLDAYLETKQRYRRFSQFKIRLSKDGDELAIEKLPHRPFIQGGNYNKMYGAIRRQYEPIEVDVTPVVHYCAKRAPIVRERDYLIRTHQFRTIVTPNIVGSCVPEGPHRDGVDVGVMVCINRANIAGGRTQVSRTLTGAPIFDQAVEAGSAIVIKDKEVYHNVTEIELASGASEGHRDMLFWGFIPWEEGRYGATHEDALEAGLEVEY